jgi:hypothetical protein
MPQSTRLRARTARLAVAALAAAAALPACSNRITDRLLAAPDPDLIDPATVRSAEGAQAVYVGTFSRLNSALLGTGTESGQWLFSGLLADEWSTSSTFIQNDEADQRKIVEFNSTNTNNFRGLNRVRTAANQAIAALGEFRPTESFKAAEMYFQRGIAELHLGSDFCNGVPLSDASGGTFTLGPPESNAQLFQRAVASFDSALALAAGTDANTVLVNRAARVGKARALLALGNARAAEAAALVPASAVPTSFAYDLTFTLTTATNNLWTQGRSNRRYSVGDSVEGNARNLRVANAIPFFSARDPRVPVTYTVSTRGDTTRGQDGFTFSRTTTLFGQLTPVSVVSGLDARLVEAEARLIANDVPGMMTVLNALRAAPPRLGAFGAAGELPTLAALPALAAPATRDAAVDLFFREKAFWTFGRGQRLGDLRRLIRSYGRTPENTFPTGTHYRGGPYGADVNLPVPTEERTNSAFTGCTDRNA